MTRRISIKIILAHTHKHTRARTRLLTSKQQAAWQHTFDMGILCVCVCEPHRKVIANSFIPLFEERNKSIIMNNAPYTLHVVTLCFVFFLNRWIFIVCGIFVCSISNYLIEGSIRSCFSSECVCVCALHNNKLKWFENISMKQKGARTREWERNMPLEDKSNWIMWLLSATIYIHDNLAANCDFFLKS